VVDPASDAVTGDGNLSSRFSLRGTGLVVFAGNIVSVFTGLVFLVMVTRSVSPSAFGLWEFIYDIVLFTSYPAVVIAFWVLRKVARGHALAKTGLLVSAVSSTGGAVAYIVSSIVVHGIVGSAFSHFLLGAMMVPLFYWYTVANAIAYARKPTITTYSLLLSEGIKLLTGYTLLFVHPIGVDGVIIALEVAYFVHAGLSTFQFRGILTDKIDFREGKSWFLTSWGPHVYALASLVLISDTFVAPLVFSGTTAAGYYQAAFTIASIIRNASFLSIALYPILLGGRTKGVPSVALDFFLLFSVPMVVGTIVLSRPLLYLLKPAYVAVQLSLPIMAVSVFFLSMSTFLDSTLLGIETADACGGGSPNQYSGTAITFVPKVNLFYAAGYIFLVSIAFKATAGIPVPEIVLTWAAVQLGATMSMILVKLNKAMQKKALSIPRSAGKYAIGNITMAAAAELLSATYLKEGPGLVGFGTKLVAIVLISAIVYFGTVYAVDASFRRLVGRFLSLAGIGQARAAGMPPESVPSSQP
jgi:O-antigen/teichoic acid export membrane protein